MIHINEIKLEEKDSFSKIFNECSEHWKKSHDASLSEKEREENSNLWLMKRQCMELGMY
jgi:hypothetical protein